MNKSLTQWRRFAPDWKQIVWLLFICLQVNAVTAQAPDTLFTSSKTEALAYSGPVKLDLSKQKLDSVPNYVFQIAELVALDLSKNRIRVLPKNIGQCQNLEVLKLSRNRIQTLTASITELSELRVLHADRNPLNALPEEIGNLKALSTLVLWDTEITYVPASLKNCESLTFLDLRTVVMTREEQAEIKALVPAQAKAKYSMPCKCN